MGALGSPYRNPTKHLGDGIPSKMKPGKVRPRAIPAPAVTQNTNTFFVKMFAVAAQTTVRAAQVKAQGRRQGAEVRVRAPAISGILYLAEVFFPGDRRPAREARTTTTTRARRSRADASRIDAYRYRAYRTPRRSRASSRVVSELVRVARTTKSWLTSRAEETLTETVPLLFSVRSSLSSKAAGAAAALFLFASPAAFADGLTVQNGTNTAPGKYEQPFYDPRPVVEVEKDSSADISTEAARVAANKQKGMKNCKTITGAPCVGSSEIATM